MNTSKKAVPVVKTFSTSTRALALTAIRDGDKAANSKIAFFDALFADGIMPSELPLYADDLRLLSLTTFPKKVQDGIASKLIRKTDLIRGVKTERTKVFQTKHYWQNRVNKKADRLVDGYTSYLAREHHMVEVAGTLQPLAIDEMGRAVRLPKAEKPLAVKTVEDAYVKQEAWSNIKSPTTLEVEMAKDYMRILDRAKSMSTEARARFNQLSAPKASGAKKQVTAKAKK